MQDIEQGQPVHHTHDRVLIVASPYYAYDHNMVGRGWVRRAVLVPPPPLNSFNWTVALYDEPLPTYEEALDATIADCCKAIDGILAGLPTAPEYAA